MSDETMTATARDELAPRGLDLDSETSEAPRFWRCMCCRFATAVEREIHVHLDETGHGFVSDNHYAALLASLADTVRLDWLSEDCAQNCQLIDMVGGEWRATTYNGAGQVETAHESMRDAIDEAMAGQARFAARAKADGVTP